jgi:hypothetical protein
MHSIISVDVSVDARERVHDPQKCPDLLLIRIVDSLGGDIGTDSNVRLSGCSDP